MDSAKRVMSGTFGEVWLDGDYVAEIFKMQGKFTFNKTEITQAGKMVVDSKVTSVKGTGSLGMHKVNSRMAIKIGEAILNGKDLRFTVVSKLDDPDAYGAERVALSGVSFDDLTLIDWEAGVVGKIECPFTFTDRKFLDQVTPR